MTKEWLTVLLILVVCPSVFAQEEAALPEGVSYVDGREIVPRADRYGEAQDWGMCGAIYLVSADLFMQDSPATMKRAEGLSRGARMAAWVTLFAPVISELADSENPDMDRFAASWESAKTTSGSMLEASMTRLASDMEIYESKGSLNQWVADIGATMEVCANSSKTQEAKINIMREMTSSGLFTIPQGQ
ncbi:Uncharacterised protein [Halioglobus japonicus]|nr:Uncharacterised protein [Halioglobus japonicus]